MSRCPKCSSLRLTDLCPCSPWCRRWFEASERRRIICAPAQPPAPDKFNRDLFDQETTP